MFNSKHTAGRHRLPEVPWRPRKVQRLASLALLGAIGAAASVIITAPHAESSPGQCIRAGGWGGFCDSLPLTADGVSLALRAGTLRGDAGVAGASIDTAFIAPP